MGLPLRLGLGLVALSAIYIGATSYVELTKGLDITANPDAVVSGFAAILIAAAILAAGLWLLIRVIRNGGSSAVK